MKGVKVPPRGDGSERDDAPPQPPALTEVDVALLKVMAVRPGFAVVQVLPEGHTYPYGRSPLWWALRRRGVKLAVRGDVIYGAWTHEPVT